MKERRRCRDASRKAFTLIELLVVIAIIAMLLAILVPSLKRAKQQAQGVICRSNLKQWGTIWNLYLTDFKNRFPDPFDSNNQQVLWVGPLKTYYQGGGEEMRVCPAATRTEFLAPGWSYAWQVVPPGAPEEQFQSSYGVNNWVYDHRDRDGDGLLWGRELAYHWKRSDVSQGTSQIPLFLDCFRWGGHPRDWRYDQPFDDAGSPHGYTPLPQTYEEFFNNCLTSHEMRRFCLDRHHGGVNVLFLDQSVDRVSLPQLWQLRWHKAFDTQGFRGVWPNWISKYK
jgi:prepilin-type N-terminal cleavage/methylation domain-containing protein